MKRVIKDKAKFTKISQKVIEKDFISMSSMKKWILEEDIASAQPNDETVRNYQRNEKLIDLTKSPPELYIECLKVLKCLL